MGGDKKYATPEDASLSPGTSSQKAMRPKPRPRRRGLNQEQQRGGRKPRATLAAPGARGGVAHCWAGTALSPKLASQPLA